MTWKPVTKVSAHNVPIAAPMEPKIGINIKFNIKLEQAPIIYEINEIFSLFSAGKFLNQLYLQLILYK